MIGISCLEVTVSPNNSTVGHWVITPLGSYYLVKLFFNLTLYCVFFYSFMELLNLSTLLMIAVWLLYPTIFRETVLHLSTLQELLCPIINIP